MKTSYVFPLIDSKQEHVLKKEVLVLYLEELKEVALQLAIPFLHFLQPGKINTEPKTPKDVCG